MFADIKEICKVHIVVSKTLQQPVILHVLCCQLGFVLVCVISPTARSPNSISTPRDASWQETQHMAAMEMSKHTGHRLLILHKLKCLVIHLKIFINENRLKSG